MSTPNRNRSMPSNDSPGRRPVRAARPARLLTLLALLLVVALPSPVRAEDEEPNKPAEPCAFRLTLSEDGALKVDETLEFTGPMEGQPGGFDRAVEFPPSPNAYPLRARLVDVAVTDANGKTLPWRTRHYGASRTRIDVGAPMNERGTYHVSYTLLGLSEVRGDGVTLRWSLGVSGRAYGCAATLALTLPKGIDATKAKLTANSYLDGPARPIETQKVSGRTIRWDLGAEETPALEFALELPAGAVAPPDDYVERLKTEAGFPLLLALILLVLAPILRFLPPPLVIGFSRLWHLAMLAVVAWLMLPLSSYWLPGYAEDGWSNWLSNGLSELGAGLGLVLFVGGVFFFQDRALRRVRREAFFTELALPILVAPALPLASVQPALLFLPLMALPIWLYWWRSRLAFYLGANAHLLAEHVATQGTVPLADLASEFGLNVKRLRGILDGQPELGIVPDWDSGVAYSPAAAAHIADLHICPNCGGGLVTTGMDLSACSYCGRNYADSREAGSSKPPVPVLVEAFATIFDAFSWIAAAWGVTVMVVTFLIEIVDGDMAAALIGIAIEAVIFGFLFWLFQLGAKGLRDGKGGGNLKGLLLLLSPLVLPALAYRSLSSKRVQLFFGALKPSVVGDEVERLGEMDFPTLAGFLETTVEEATEVASYLAGADQIDAVYDRIGRRLVARRLYREMATKDSCLTCGGIVGVVGGAVACHHCGAPSGS